MHVNVLKPLSYHKFLRTLNGVWEALKRVHVLLEARGGVVVKALRYKPAGRGFDSRCCHWNFSVT
jgi:hypothetical protein